MVSTVSAKELQASWAPFFQEFQTNLDEYVADLHKAQIEASFSMTSETKNNNLVFTVTDNDTEETYSIHTMDQEALETFLETESLDEDQFKIAHNFEDAVAIFAAKTRDGEVKVSGMTQINPEETISERISQISSDITMLMSWIENPHHI